LVTANAVHRFRHDDVELPSQCGGKELLDTGSLDNGETGDCIVTKFRNDLPRRPLGRIFAAYQKLAIDRFRVLLVA
jgi:hypothetical protein